MATLAEQLTAVETAIYEIVTRRVASVSLEGRSYTYQDLAALREWRDQIRLEQARTARGTFSYGSVR